MADIKLVIKIPDNYDLSKIKNGSIASKIILDAVKNGTPLDDAKAEMRRRAVDPWNMTVGSASQGLMDAIEILDNIGETNKEGD